MQIFKYAKYFHCAENIGAFYLCETLTLYLQKFLNTKNSIAVDESGPGLSNPRNREGLATTCSRRERLWERTAPQVQETEVLSPTK